MRAFDPTATGPLTGVRVLDYVAPDIVVDRCSEDVTGYRPEVRGAIPDLEGGINTSRLLLGRGK